MPLTVSYQGPSTIFRFQQSILGKPCAGLRAIHQMCSISSPHNPVTIWSNRVYGLSTDGATSGTY